MLILIFLNCLSSPASPGLNASDMLVVFALCYVVGQLSRTLNCKLKVLGAEHGRYQAGLAKKLKVSRQTINAIEKKKYAPQCFSSSQDRQAAWNANRRHFYRRLVSHLSLMSERVCLLQ
jgi:hypothetical protein